MSAKIVWDLVSFSVWSLRFIHHNSNERNKNILKNLRFIHHNSNERNKNIFKIVKGRIKIHKYTYTNGRNKNILKVVEGSMKIHKCIYTE